MRFVLVFSVALLSLLSGGERTFAVELPPCTGTLENKVTCLNNNLATLNKTVEVVVADLRGRLDKAEGRIKALEDAPKPVDPKPVAFGWSVGCTNGVCAAVNATGGILYIDGSNFTTSQSQLPGTVTGPVSISCTLINGEQCWAVDAAGRKWRGNARNIGQPFVGPF